MKYCSTASNEWSHFRVLYIESKVRKCCITWWNTSNCTPYSMHDLYNGATTSLSCSFATWVNRRAKARNVGLWIFIRWLTYLINLVIIYFSVSLSHRRITQFLMKRNSQDRKQIKSGTLVFLIMIKTNRQFCNCLSTFSHICDVRGRKSLDRSSVGRSKGCKLLGVPKGITSHVTCETIARYIKWTESRPEKVSIIMRLLKY